MNRDSLLRSLAAVEDDLDQLAVIRDGLRLSLEQAAASADPVRAQRDELLAWQQHIVALLQVPPPPDVRDPVAYAHRRVRIVNAATQHWLSALKTFRFRHRARVHRRVYREEDAGAPAFRDHGRHSLRLLWADAWSEPDERLHRMPFAAVEPYVDHRRPQAARAAAYRQWAAPRRIVPTDLQTPHEAALLGQRGVFAVREIPALTCVGVYGGQLLDDVEVFLLKDDRYLMALRSGGGPSAVNGENLMSLTNTRFLYDEAGQPCGHPPEGYTLRRVVFRARLSGDWLFGLPAFFTTRDIAPGEELRWDYALQSQ